MRTKRFISAGALALALATAAVGPAQGATSDIPVNRAQEVSDGVVSGVEYVVLPNVNVGHFERRVACCPAGKKVIGGGAEARGENAILVGSFPNEDMTGWVGIGRQPGAPDVGIQVTAICANID